MESSICANWEGSSEKKYLACQPHSSPFGKTQYPSTPASGFPVRVNLASCGVSIRASWVHSSSNPAFCDPFNGQMLFQLTDTIISKSTIFRNEDSVNENFAEANLALVKGLVSIQFSVLTRRLCRSQLPPGSASPRAGAGSIPKCYKGLVKIILSPLLLIASCKLPKRRLQVLAYLVATPRHCLKVRNAFSNM